MKNGWQTKTLGEVLQKGETVNPRQSPEDEFDYIDVSSVSNETFRIEQTQRLKGKDAPSRARRLVKANDVLFATVRPTLQRIAVVPDEFDGHVCSTGYFVLRPKAELDHRFVFYSLLTKDFLERMEALQAGASYPAVNDGQVRAQTLSYPEVPEQRRIVGILDEAFDGIATAKANAKKNLQNASALFESHLNAVFTQRGEGWEEKRIPDVCLTFGRGKSRHRPRNEPSLYGGDHPFIQTGDLNNADHVVTTYTQTYSDKGLKQSKMWPRGTVGIAIVGATIGETGVLGFDGCFPDSVIGMTVDPTKADPFFVEYMLQNFKDAVKSQGEGSARHNINLGTFDRLLFPMPSVTKQQRIVESANALRIETQRLESVYQRKLAALDELKKSLLHQAFSGEL